MIFVNHTIRYSLTVLIIVLTVFINAVSVNAAKHHKQELEAIEKLSKEMGSSPSKKRLSELYYQRADFYQHIGQYQKAIDDYSKELALDSDPKGLYPLTYQYRARAYERNQQFANAIYDYSRAIEMDLKKQNGQGSLEYFERGCAKTRQKQFQTAIHAYTKTIALLPKDGIAYYFRAQSYNKLGKHILAERDLRSAKNLGYKDKGYYAQEAQKFDSGPLGYDD